uniref:L-type lectin-like domain-containing protein n=1 Tax=Anas platyrhynchos platyrhynchos TaxID=8840 RepID=A0A493TZ44_ANAPP
MPGLWGTRCRVLGLPGPWSFGMPGFWGVPGFGVPGGDRVCGPAGVGSASSGLWDLQGNAMVMPQYIRLTPDLQSKRGAVWNRVPCYLRDWELQVHFKIHGQGKKNLNGDGFAIWYTKDRMQPGERSGTLRAVPGAPGLPREPSVELQRCGVRGLLPLRAGRPKRE